MLPIKESIDRLELDECLSRLWVDEQKLLRRRQALSELLADYSDLDAVHIVSHGGDAGIQ